MNEAGGGRGAADDSDDGAAAHASGGERVRYPMDAPATLTGAGGAGDADLRIHVRELMLERAGGELTGCTLRFTVAADALRRAPLPGAGPGTAGPGGEGELEVTAAFDVSELGSLPANAATLRRELGTGGPLTVAANWTVTEVTALP